MLAWVSPTLETAVYGFGSGIKLFVRMKAGYFLHNAGSSVSLPFCLSELCGGHGCVSCSVWVDRTCGKLRAPGVAADIQVSRRCNRWSCPGRLVNVLNEGVNYRCVWVTWRVVWSACFTWRQPQISHHQVRRVHIPASACVSVWSPAHRRSRRPSPASCKHLVCPSPWQSVSVSLFDLLFQVFFISLSLRKNRFCVMNHRNFCHMWTSSNNSRPRAITGIQLLTTAAACKRQNSPCWFAFSEFAV